MPGHARMVALAAALIAALAAAAAPAAAGPRDEPETIAERTAADRRMGEEAAPEIRDAFGGPYEDAALSAYVETVGRRIAAVSEQAGEPWTFTVLDSPTVNAFALPNGQVFVTRGLIALANTEAELASVIGHEIGHVTAGHAGSRQSRGAWATGLLLGARVLGSILGVDEDLLDAGGQLGQMAAGGLLADYSREDELVSDRLGLRYLARAGYDPAAQATFLDSLSAHAALEARAAGREPGEDTTGFFDTHPATAERARLAAAMARDMPLAGPGVAGGADRHLDAVDGIVFGDSAAQGFVRDGRFVHPRLRFAFDVPEGFTVRNTPKAVRAAGPDGARLVFDGVADPGGSLERFILDHWLPAIAQQFPAGRPDRVRTHRLDGREAATARLFVDIRGQRHDAVLTVVRGETGLYRLAGMAPQGSATFGEVAAAATSFDRLSEREAAALRPARLAVITVPRGATVASLAVRMTGPDAEARFRVLNGLAPDEEVWPGQRVKIVL